MVEMPMRKQDMSYIFFQKTELFNLPDDNFSCIAHARINQNQAIQIFQEVGVLLSVHINEP